MQNIANEVAHWAAAMADSMVKAERCAWNWDAQGQSYFLSEARRAAAQLSEGGIDVASRVKMANLAKAEG